VIHITAGSWSERSQKGVLLAVINVFTAGPAFGLVLNTMLVFVAVSYAEPVV
jgi:hypothetical protein